MIDFYFKRIPKKKQKIKIYKFSFKDNLNHHYEAAAGLSCLIFDQICNNTTIPT